MSDLIVIIWWIVFLIWLWTRDLKIRSMNASTAHKNLLVGNRRNIEKRAK